MVDSMSATSRRLRPRHQPNAPGGLVEHRGGQPRQQRHPFRQSGGEVQFPVHRAPRDRSDMGPQADEIGQLVEHLVLDDRRFEVGDEDPLAASVRRLDQHIDRRIADHLPGSRFGRLRVGIAQRQVARGAGREPVGRADRQRPCERRDDLRQITPGAGSGD
jgi:hypothetical protein